MRRQHALNQQFELAAAGLLAEQPRLDDFGVVEHQQVARLQQIGQVAKAPVDERVGPAIEQARSAARSAAGCWAISASGSSKSKSLRVKARGAPDKDVGIGLEGRLAPYQVK